MLEFFQSFLEQVVTIVTSLTTPTLAFLFVILIATVLVAIITR